MPRTLEYQGLILRTKPSGESNRELWILTAEEGILRVTMFGGPKSRLRSHATVFNSGRIWIYHDPVRDSRKLNDFDVRSWRPGLRELYERTMTADAIMETILASHGGGGNWDTALALTESVLDSLESANEELCEKIFIYFLWRWASFLGIEPETDICVHCGKKIETDTTLWYSMSSNGLFCPSCAHPETQAAKNSNNASNANASQKFFPVNAGCRLWLEKIRTLPPSQLSGYSTDAQGLREAKAFTSAILTAALGKRPGSWSF